MQSLRSPCTQQRAGRAVQQGHPRLAASVPLPLSAVVQHSPEACSSSCQPRVVMRASKLGDVSLFGSSSSSGSLLGGGPMGAEDTKQKPKIDDVALESEVGMDYTALRDHLKAADFRQAEDETRALLIRLAGEGAVKRGWVYFSEVKSISVTDFRTMDNLWKTASNGKFGYSVQRELFLQSQKRWSKFFKQIGWVQGPNNVYLKWPMEFIYSMEAPKGHLPLTNALRGTQLFEAVLAHPAWDVPANKKQSIDDSARAAGANTMKF